MLELGTAHVNNSGGLIFFNQRVKFYIWYNLD